MRAVGLFAIGLALVAGGCSAATNDPAADALLRLSGAQFYRGKPPAPSDGPAVQQVTTLPSGTARRGINNTVQGFVDRSTTAVAVYIDGDVGYWIVQPGNIDVGQGGALSFSAPAAFPNDLPMGTYTLHALAADSRGHFGSAIDLALRTEDVSPMNTLTVSLAWDTEVDLDLHLVIPDGTEIWANKISSLPSPQPGQPNDPTKGGILDFDSNGNCVIDGRRMENIFWTVAAPSGHYLVRVDTWSMCAESWANWRVTASMGDQTLGLASGFTRPTDVEFKHGVGSGTKALEFDIP
jgi:hypothetical protein